MTDDQKNKEFSHISPCHICQPIFHPAMCPRSLGPPAQEMHISIYTHSYKHIKDTQDMSPEAKMDPINTLPAVLVPGRGPAALPPSCPQDMLIPEGREIISFLQKKVQIRFSHPSPRRKGGCQSDRSRDPERNTARHCQRYSQTHSKDTAQRHCPKQPERTPKK